MDKIKIIHARGLIPAVISFFPAKIFGVKLFFDTRGLLADKYVGGDLLKKDSLVYRLMKSGERFLIDKSDYFSVETNKHAQILKNFNSAIADKMEVIPCCVDTDKFNYLKYSVNLQEDTFNLVYLGKIGTWYLLDEMLDFFKVLNQKLPNSSFTFITHDNLELFYSRARKKGIANDKMKIKKLAKEQIPAVLAQGDAGIFFINPYERYNSSPIKFGEYLASGLAVVINAGIGDTDVITEKENVGVVVKDFNTGDYRVACEDLIQLLKKKSLLKQKCRETAERYLGLKEGIEKYLVIYHKLYKQ